MAKQALNMIYITQSRYACSVSLFGRPAVRCMMTLQGRTSFAFMLSQHLLRCPDSSSPTSPPVVRFLRSQYGVPRRRIISNMAIEDCTQPMHGNSITASSNLFRRKGDSLPRSSDKTYSLASVARHSTPSDCWVIVRDKVYDVTAWVPQHPGGALIYVSAGKDCTQLFDSYHPLYARYQSYALQAPTIRFWSATLTLCCRAVLQKFYIGNLARQAGEVAAVTYQQPPEEQQFYTVLRQRVERHFRKNEVCNHSASDLVEDACSVDSTIW